MTDDIVSRLRDLKNAMNECGFTGISAVTNSAADEIERLRDQVTAAHESHGNEVGALEERLSLAIHERDEARRDVCSLRRAPASCDEGIAVAMREYARIMGWDCFKEDADDR